MALDQKQKDRALEALGKVEFVQSLEASMRQFASELDRLNHLKEVSEADIERVYALSVKSAEWLSFLMSNNGFAQDIMTKLSGSPVILK